MTPTRMAADVLVACLMVGIGSCIGGVLRLPLALPIVVAGFAVASRAAWRADERPAPAWRPATCALLAVMTVVGFVAPPSVGAMWYDVAKRVFFVLGFIVAGVCWRGDARQARRAVNLVIVSAIGLHLATPIAVPAPNFDVWIWTQSCLQALLRGVHPYTVQVQSLITDVYRLGPTASVYPYTPLTLLAFAPGYAVFGDYRVIAALCVPATVALNRSTGRRLGLDRRFIDATTLALLLYPRGTFITCYGWTESLLVAAISLFVYLAIRAPEGVGQAVAFFLLPALKQYVVAPVLIFVAMKRARASAVALAATVAAATVVPFLIWDWRSTLAGIVVQMVAPARPRLDSISLVALVGVTTGLYASRWLGVVVQVIVGALAYARLRHAGLGGLLLASALSLYASFLTGWQAFMNYYYFVAETLLLSAVVLAAARSAPEVVSSTAHV